MKKLILATAFVGLLVTSAKAVEVVGSFTGTEIGQGGRMTGSFGYDVLADFADSNHGSFSGYQVISSFIVVNYNGLSYSYTHTDYDMVYIDNGPWANDGFTAQLVFDIYDEAALYI